jgi:hypothetical protein
MVEYVKLTSRDLNLLIDVVQRMVDYKFYALTKANYQDFEQNWLPSLVEQMRENRFKFVTASQNIFLWLIDNICHSRQVVPGLKKKDWIPLMDFEDVQRCLSVLRAARFGQSSYDRISENQFDNLFTK